ncbi:ribonuclease HII [Streptomonospora sp. S1-112]|uniref:Ribonuclease HII n=1 Tax=Streptomonospora mangrovi TaxID=2883123 RepID=A0A9X3NMN5_9ACTN|nr:ribonuclease HII [Streptomonospora mangrovi]MDA0566123.1 ribonuclease HII [Streptomonospora mangrovi]
MVQTSPSTPAPAAAPPVPCYDLERELAAEGAALVAGVDEVGRGAWAGPVVVCAAVTDGTPPPEGLTDSKRLTPQRRAAMAELLRPWVRDHAFGQADPAEIDDLGMTRALRLAASRALAGLRHRPDAVILDGKHDFLGSPWRVRTQIQADLRCVSVAAASVLAKVHRDTYMAGLDTHFPDYGFATGVGYPSPVHRAALADLGPTPHHRMSWAYLDDLPKWRHLRRPRPQPDGQTALL